MPNRLAQETSPYLLQHQNNPVDWHPWGAEAIERARREDKPIFLSVGYSTCYWCHVMERQSFENDAVAAVMNEKFINIKVDREERPDVDQLYMTAVQLLTRHGGWPMSVWLTPDLRPFYGGTYFPPGDQHGRPGFVSLLHALEDAYRNRRDDVQRTASQIVGVLQRVAEPERPSKPIRIDTAFIDELVQRSASDYDPVFGGFGGAPKFPRETLLELLLVYLRDQSADDVRKRVLHSLDALAAGGIRDHLGGGFHRYSTDSKWLVPHFEIMLYDNAMLAGCYVDAFRQTGRPHYSAVARGVLDFVLREMTSSEGAFYTAFDAEVDGQEGLNYLWTSDEIVSILGSDDAKIFNEAYGVHDGPNFADPHHGSGVADKSILFLPKPISADLYRQLEPMRQKLKAARDRRKQPLLDTKILTSWNAMMIRAFAYAGQVLAEPRYIAAARRAAEFLLQHHRTPDGGLFRTSRDGRAKYDGFLDDYAYFVLALIALEDAEGASEWRDRAADLARTMLERFGDPAGAGGLYFTDARSNDLIVRQKTATDSPLPSGNAVAAMALLALGQPTAARQIIAAFAQQIHHNGEGMSAMVQAAMLYLRQTGEPFTVSSGPVDEARPISPAQSAEQVVRVSTLWKTPTELHVQLSIRDGFHVNASDAAGDAVPLIPTRINIADAPAGMTIDYPTAKALQTAFTQSPIQVYAGDITCVVRFAQAVQSPLQLAVSYQPCDETACLAPATLRLAIEPP